MLMVDRTTDKLKNTGRRRATTSTRATTNVATVVTMTVATVVTMTVATVVTTNVTRTGRDNTSITARELMMTIDRTRRRLSSSGRPIRGVVRRTNQIQGKKGQRWCQDQRSSFAVFPSIGEIQCVGAGLHCVVMTGLVACRC